MRHEDGSRLQTLIVTSNKSVILAHLYFAIICLV